MEKQDIKNYYLKLKIVNLTSKYDNYQYLCGFMCLNLFPNS